jgi:hypothetical protein
MTAVDIPPTLVRMLAEQRVIPFIGSGYSATLELPQWDALLAKLAHELQGDGTDEDYVPFEQISDACRGDHLQIAEYLFLRAGSAIGPIRHALDSSLQNSSEVIDSTAHVELVNLSAPQVYTTNYDDLIELCFRSLGVPVDVIAIARDVARSDPTRTQVVKYHGDLRHEHTLVLTESQYYRRLEFESPMDLKLRADLLGRAVLFIGYSFSDINIRVIWFKLMQTMEEVPEKDRLPSFIVRLTANPVLDQLYEAVGLTTIVIDPDGAASDPSGANACLADFMLRLSMEVERARKGKSVSPVLVSLGLIEAINRELEVDSARQVRLPRQLRTRGQRGNDGSIKPETASTQLMSLLEHLTSRSVPDELLAACLKTVERVGRGVSFMSSSSLAASIATWILGCTDVSKGATLLVAAALSREESREAVLGANLSWTKVWAAQLSSAEVAYLLDLCEAEVEGHEEKNYEDVDVAFCIDVARRIAAGEIIEDGVDEQQQRAVGLIARLTEIYPTSAEYELEARPAPAELVEEIESAIRERHEDEDEEEKE